MDTLARKPFIGCNKCYGNGHLGKDSDGNYVPCSCALEPTPVAPKPRFIPMKGKSLKIDGDRWTISKVLSGNRFILKRGGK